MKVTTVSSLALALVVTLLALKKKSVEANTAIKDTEGVILINSFKPGFPFMGQTV